MRLTVIGCSGSMPGPDGPASCYLVERDDTVILLDLGSGALGVLQQHVDLARLDAVLLTHLHPDHCLDLCALHVARRYGRMRGTDPLPVYGPRGTDARVAAAYDDIGDPAHDMSQEFDFRDLTTLHRLGAFSIRVAGMAHSVPTYAIRLDAGGASVVYSGDTGPNEALVDISRGVDLLVAEAADVDRPDNVVNLHMSGRQAGTMARRAGVAHLMVTHVPPWHDRDVALAEARAEFDGRVTLASTGLVIDLEGGS